MMMLNSTKNFVFQILTGRWFTVFASFLVMSVSGATYMFGLYSGDLKSSLGYDQRTLNLLSFFKDLGANVGIVSGLINEVSPPFVVLSLGAALNFFGYFMVWLAVSGKIPTPQIWQMCAYICIGANSQSFANTGALVTSVKNFPASRGVVLGLLKGYVGLSGAIITQLYRAAYGDDSRSLILFIAWLPAAVAVMFLPTIRVLGRIRVRETEQDVFYRLLYASLALAGFLMGGIIMEKRYEFSRGAYKGMAVVVAILVALPLLVVAKAEYDDRFVSTEKEAFGSKSKIEIRTSSTSGVQSQSQTEKTLLKESSCWMTMFRAPARGDDYTILQALFSIDMLVLFIATICGVGGTLTAIDNLGQIGDSLGYPKQSISTFVSLVSIWNYLGRVVAGFLSEILLKKFKFPRPLMLTLTLFFSCLGHLLIAFGVPHALYAASVIIGFCFGAQWPLLFAIISEIFGLKFYSTLYNFGSVASPIGSYLLSVRVAGFLYDKEAERQMRFSRRVGGDLRCVGTECYKLAFIIIAAVTMFGAMVSMVLVIRTREFYAGDIYRKFQEEEETRAPEKEMGSCRSEAKNSNTIESNIKT